jgi:hypothetical protein
MADAIFDFWGEFCKRLSIAFGDEDGIVTKSSLARF